jgi:hypothetical protein
MRHVALVLGAVSCVATFSCGAAAPGDPEAVAGVDALDRVEPAAATVDHVTAAAALPAIGFVPAQGCRGIGGTWRGQVYSDPHGGYYDFTLRVAEPSAGQAALAGSIVARSWEGGRDDVAPPDGCDGSYHWTVVEDAAGRIGDDGSFAFAGTSWRVGEHLCGDRVTDYSFDRLAARVPGGAVDGLTRMTGVVSDDVVWVNGGLPIDLTRVACE